MRYVAKIHIFQREPVHFHFLPLYGLIVSTVVKRCTTHQIDASPEEHIICHSRHKLGVSSKHQRASQQKKRHFSVVAEVHPSCSPENLLRLPRLVYLYVRNSKFPIIRIACTDDPIWLKRQESRSSLCIFLATVSV